MMSFVWQKVISVWQVVMGSQDQIRYILVMICHTNSLAHYLHGDTPILMREPPCDNQLFTPTVNARIIG